jgi:opacity protein-like surface antigen
MKKTILAAALAIGATFGAHAADAAAPFRFLLGAGLTFGGDTLATVTFSDGRSEDIRGGGLVHLYAGGDFRVTDVLSLQATVGYHVDDSSSASNGGVRFTRVPVDLLALYHVNDRFRLGGGAQFVSGPALKGSGVASNINLEFKNTTGAIVEGEYLFSPHMGAKLRYVAEKFEPARGGPKAKGDHLGLMFSYYF